MNEPEMNPRLQIHSHLAAALKRSFVGNRGKEPPIRRGRRQLDPISLSLAICVWKFKVAIFLTFLIVRAP